MTVMMAGVNSMSLIGAREIIGIWLGIIVVRPHVVPIGIIIVTRRIGNIATRKSKTHSPNSRNSAGKLSVRTLHGNQS